MSLCIFCRFRLENRRFLPPASPIHSKICFFGLPQYILPISVRKSKIPASCLPNPIENLFFGLPIHSATRLLTHVALNRQSDECSLPLYNAVAPFWSKLTKYTWVWSTWQTDALERIFPSKQQAEASGPESTCCFVEMHMGLVTLAGQSGKPSWSNLSKYTWFGQSGRRARPKESFRVNNKLMLQGTDRNTA